MNTTKILRHINAIRCLRLLHDGRSLSRADIARELGLTRATIGNAMIVLEDAGYVIEGETHSTEGRKGRPGVGVSLNPTGAYFVGIDIGPRVLTAVVVDLRMNVVSRIVEPTGADFRNADNIQGRILDLVRRVTAEASVPESKIEGLCVSVPGLVGRDGSVINAPFLEWRNYPLRKNLVAACDAGWIVTVCNDAFAFANAEASRLSPASGGSVLLVLMAEGLGGAVIDAGTHMMGAHGFSGEIGHTVITVEGRTDTFEMFAGAKAFSSLINPEFTVAEGVASLLAMRDGPAVGEALDQWTEALAIGFANAVHLLDPGRIVLGGPVALLYPCVEKQVQEKLADKLLAGFSVPPISVSKIGADGAAIGAAATIREAIFTLPELE